MPSCVWVIQCGDAILLIALSVFRCAVMMHFTSALGLNPVGPVSSSCSVRAKQSGCHVLQLQSELISLQVQFIIRVIRESKDLKFKFRHASCFTKLNAFLDPVMSILHSLLSFVLATHYYFHPQGLHTNSGLVSYSFWEPIAPRLFFSRCTFFLGMRALLSID